MTLSLPKIGRRKAPRIPTPDIMAPVKMAQADAAKIRAISSGVLSLGGMAKGYYDRVKRQEVRDATMSVHKADMEFRTNNDGKEEYDVMAVDDENFINIADEMGYEDPGAPVPAHQVYPRWRKKNYEDSIAEAAKGIGNADARAAFIQEHEAKGATQFTNDFVMSTKQQIKYHANQVMTEVEASLKSRDFTSARLAVDTSEMSSARKKAANDDINLREQNDFFEEVIERRESIPLMEKALDQLDKNAPNTSELKAGKQAALASRLRTAIGVEKNAIKKGAQAGQALAKEDVKNAIDDTWNGLPINYTKLEKDIAVVGATSPVLTREAKWTVDNQPRVSRILMEHPTDQANFYNSRLEMQNPSAEDSYLTRQLGKAIDAGNKARQTDAVAWANKTGFIVDEPIDFSTPATIGDGLGKKLKNAIAIQQGFNAYTGLFTTAGMEVFGNRIENADTKTQLDIFGSVSDGLGKYAAPLYEQLKKHGIAGTANIAGQLVAKGEQYRPVAKKILEGAELMRSNVVVQQKMKDENTALNSFVTDNFGTMFAGNAVHQSLMAESFKNIYAVVGDKQGAFDQLVGDVAEFNGSTIQDPTGGKFMSHVESLTKEYWEEVEAHGWSGMDIREGVLTGNLTLVGVSENVSNLVNKKGETVTQPDGITPLSFVIDGTEPTYAQRKIEQAEDAQEVKKARELEARKSKAERAVEIQRTWDEVGGPRIIGTQGVTR